MLRIRRLAALPFSALLIGCGEPRPVPVAPTPDPQLMVKCAPADQVPAPPWSDKQVAGIIVDGRTKLADCSSRFDALAAWVAKAWKPVK